MTHDPAATDINRPIARVLLVGMLLSIAMMLVGLALLGLNPHTGAGTVLPVDRAFTEITKAHAQPWLSLGILVLILTPLAALLTAVGSFARVRDWEHAIMAAIALLAMAAGLLLGRA